MWIYKPQETNLVPIEQGNLRKSSMQAIQEYSQIILSFLIDDEVLEKSYHDIVNALRKKKPLAYRLNENELFIFDFKKRWIIRIKYHSKKINESITEETKILYPEYTYLTYSIPYSNEQEALNFIGNFFDMINKLTSEWLLVSKQKILDNFFGEIKKWTVTQRGNNIHYTEQTFEEKNWTNRHWKN